MSRRIVVTGASGLIGRALCNALANRGDRVVVFSRDMARARQMLPQMAEYVTWDAAERGDWFGALDGADAVVHLAGAPIAGKRWTPAYKREILESRTRSARGLVAAIAAATQRPSVFVSASGVDYYGKHGDEPVDERTGPGRGFLPDVCVAWEAEAQHAAALGLRVAAIRTGIVLDRHEGALASLILPFQLFAGGPVLPGTQWWSWIHLDDLVGLYMLALDDDRADGALNGTAPEPERCRDFCAALGRALSRPSWAPIPLFAVELLLGEMAGPLLVDKQRAIPRRPLDLGYQFRFPHLGPALSATLDAADSPKRSS